MYETFTSSGDSMVVNISHKHGFCSHPPTHTHIHIHKPYSIIHCSSPCNDIRREAHHKCADECADFFGGPLPPLLLFIQAFLAYTVEAHR